MDEDQNVKPIRSDITPAPRDFQKPNTELFQRIMDTVDHADFDGMTIAACIGVLEMVKHEIMTRQ